MIEGIYPPIPTPFINGEISFEKLEYNLYRWNRTGINGYLVLGTNGESPFLTKKEKINLTSGTRKLAGPDKTIIVGASSESIREVIELIDSVSEEGADYALIHPPFYYRNKMTDAAVEAYFTRIADKIKIPMLLYNNPGVTNIDLSVDVVSKLGWHENIVGLKFTGENIARLGDIVASTPDDFSTLVGTASVLFPGLVMGASGGILALANFVPRECCELYRYFKEGKYDDALRLQRRLIRANNAITQKYGVAGVKTAMDMLNYFGGDPREPLMPLSDEESQELNSILINAGLM